MFVGAAITPCRTVLDTTLAYDLNLLRNELPPGLTFSRASAATDVINGVLTSFASGEPRISAANGVLVEGIRTNILQNGNVSPVGGASLSIGNVVGPDSTNNSANTLTAGAATAAHGISNTATVLHSAADYTISGFFKAGTNNRIQIAVGSAISGAFANFLLSGAGSVTNSGNAGLGAFISASIISLANGWYRCSIAYTATANTATPVAVFLLSTGSEARAPSIAFSGTETILFYGLQSEQGGSLSSYIPTTTAAATRAADVLYKDMTGIANVSEGTLFVQVNNVQGNPGAAKYLATLSDGGTLTNSADLYIINTSEVPVGRVFSASAEQANISSAVYAGGRFKHAIGYKLNDVNIAANGVLGTKDTAAAVPVTLNRLDIGNMYDGFRAVSGYVEAVRYYNKRKTDAELQAMTA